jgi:rod shape-determining protein MreC
MAAPRGGQRSRFTVMVLVMVCLTLITIDTKANGGGVLGSMRSGARDILIPAQSALGGVADPVADFADGLVNSGDLKAENSRLRDENLRLRGQVLQAADAQRQNTALLDLNKLEVVKDIPQLKARVVNTAPSNVQLTIEIDRGRDQGVTEGMPVVVGSGLVGRIESTTGRAAIVRLINDPEMSVAARLAPSGVTTSVKGNGAGALLKAELIRPDQVVPEGEAVVTSALGGNYPDGIPIGRVVLAEAVAGVSYQRVEVESLIDFGRLEFVSILLRLRADGPGVRAGPSPAADPADPAAQLPPSVTTTPLPGSTATSITATTTEPATTATSGP